MSVCSRCGAVFSCKMADRADPADFVDPAAPAQPCWCTYLPPTVPLPSGADVANGGARCWCPACLKLHMEQQALHTGKLHAPF
jgi:hypothetical protein